MIAPQRTIRESCLVEVVSVLAIGKLGNRTSDLTKHVGGTSFSPLLSQVGSQDPEEVLSASSRCESRLMLEETLATT